MEIPGYQIIFNDYEIKIRQRQLPPGTRLPSESELCRKYNVSRITVRKAMEMLADQNMILRRPGIGSFVADLYEPDIRSKEKPVNLGVELFSSDGLGGSCYYGPIQKAVHEAATALHSQVTLLPREELLRSGNRFAGRIFYSLETGDPGILAQLTENNAAPTILINRIVAAPEIGYVAVDYRDTARRLVERLLRNGASNVAITGSCDDPRHSSPYLRTQGWRDAYRIVRGQCPEELSCGFLSMNQSFSAINRLFESRTFDTVLVAMGASLPMTIAALAKNGLAVPEEINLICFDNVEENFSQMHIPISFIRIPLEQMSFQATEHLVKMARGKASGLLHKIFPASLIATDCKYLF